MKKILSYVLAVAMTLAFVPTTYAAQNMLNNSSFEEGTETWKPTSASMARVDDYAYAGNYSARVIIMGNWGNAFTPDINFKKGANYTVSAKIRLADGLGTRTSVAILDFYPGGKGEPRWMQGPPVTVNDKEWTEVTMAFCYTGPNRTAKANVQWRVGSGQEMLTYYIDDVVILSADESNYRETEYADDEMVENKGFDNDTYGWVAKNDASITRVVGEGYDNSEASGLVVAKDNGYVGVEIPVKKGQKYNMSSVLKTKGNTAFFSLFVKHTDGTLENVALLESSDENWNWLKGEYTHKREDETVMVYVSSNNTESYYIDEFSVRPYGAPIEIVEKEVISAGEVAVVVDGKKLSMPVYPVDGALLVPVAEFTYNVNGTASEADGRATLVRGINSLVINVGSKFIKENGRLKKVSVPAQYINGKICADVSAIADGFGLKVTADETSAIIKTSQGVKINNTAKKLRNNDKLTIGILTGSRPQRSGTYDPFIKNFRDILADWFTRNYANSDIKIIENDVSSTGIMLGAFRAEKFVKENDIDLLFVDVYRNDIKTTAADAELYAETLIRQVKKAKSDTDIIFLYTITEELYAMLSEGNEPESYDAYEKIAQMYSLPTINLCDAIMEDMTATGNALSKYLNAIKNPNTVANEVYANKVVEVVKKLLAESTEEYSQVNRAYGKTLVAKIQPADSAKLGDGWSLVNEPLSASETDSYIKAVTPGSEMEYTFNGNVIGIYFESNPRSGDILYSVDGGEYKSFTTFDDYSYQFEHLSAKILAKDLADGEHTLKIKVDSKKNVNSMSTEIDIAGFLVGANE